MTAHPQEGGVHATAIVLGEAGVLIRGASGTGKSALAELLLEEACRRGRFARLVGDDRILLHRVGERLLAAPHPAIAGLVERRTQPFGRLPYLRRCVVRLVVDLYAPDARLPRLPEPDSVTVELIGCAPLPWLRLQAPPGALSCRFVLDALAQELRL